jgi:hypothetical protein
MTDRTTITVSDEVWRHLNAMKGRGDSFDDVLRSELDLGEEQPATPHESEQERQDPTPTREREQLREALAGTGDLLEVRVDAVLAMRDVLRDQKRATKDELVAVVDPEVVDYADAESVWSNMAKGTFSKLDGVESPPPGKSEWRWVGEDG